jgi:hypothetical protein
MATTIQQTNQSASTDFCGNYAKGISLTADERSKQFTAASFWFETNSSKTGTISCNILNSSGVSLGTLGTLDASTVPTDSTPREYVFDTNPVSTNDSNCFISLVVPASACGLGFRYTTSPSTTDYQGFYQSAVDTTPVTTGQPYPKFSATYGGDASSGTRLPPPPAFVRI